MKIIYNSDLPVRINKKKLNSKRLSKTGQLWEIIDNLKQICFNLKSNSLHEIRLNVNSKLFQLEQKISVLDFKKSHNIRDPII